MNIGIFLFLMSIGVSYMCFHVIREIAIPAIKGDDRFGRAWGYGATFMFPICCIFLFAISFEAYQHGKDSAEWEDCIGQSRREGWSISKELGCYDLR